VWKAEVAGPDAEPALPGTVLYTDKTRICVSTGDGVLALLEVQAEGKKRMGTDAFLRGTKIPAGTLLGA
ncbi:MAG: methionyl-tRNA formyltransferase, partial [Lachnospiraceae bacterium]|nr:methionyl-tRNA formyltransferase [Lachnospiraceae bacterium]